MDSTDYWILGNLPGVFNVLALLVVGAAICLKGALEDRREKKKDKTDPFWHNFL